jgi:hypothetical protein
MDPFWESFWEGFGKSKPPKKMIKQSVQKITKMIASQRGVQQKRFGNISRRVASRDQFGPQNYNKGQCTAPRHIA